MKKRQQHREVTLHVRVKQAEADLLDDAVERLGLSRSDLLRRCLSLGLLAFEQAHLPAKDHANVE